MAEAIISVDQDQFICPVCLDLLKDPVTIPCGHSYCMNCITGCWNVNDPRGVYSCPQCRQIFTPRPILGRNIVLAKMVEKLKTQLQTGFPAIPRDVECDICTKKKKNRAVKSCLVCLNSYCPTHFDRHEKLNPGRRHKVIDATGRLQDMICQKHDKILEVFCRTDQQFVCLLCVMDEHRNHDTVSAAEEKTKMQGNLREVQRTFQQNIQERETKLKELREAVKSQKRSAQAAEEEIERIFTELILSSEKAHSDATQQIRDQERATVSRAEGELQRLKQEIDDLKRRDAELENLSHTDHHIQLFQTLQSLTLTGYPKLPRSTVISDLSFNDVRKSVSKLTEQIKRYSRELQENISNAVKHIQIICPEYQTREEYLKYFHQFTLDPNTAHKVLRLSESNKRITCAKTDLSYPDHPDRFDSWVQVLCTDGVFGRCYWEVDWDQSKYLGISVSYQSISRKGHGNECKFGYNNQSWLLLCSPNEYIFLHNSIKTKLCGVSSCSRLGVYLDHSAGVLSFYSVSDKMTLIHRVQTTFIQRLYPGFTLGRNVSMKLCDK